MPLNPTRRTEVETLADAGWSALAALVDANAEQHIVGHLPAGPSHPDPTSDADVVPPTDPNLSAKYAHPNFRVRDPQNDAAEQEPGFDPTDEGTWPPGYPFPGLPVEGVSIADIAAADPALADLVELGQTWVTTTSSDGGKWGLRLVVHEDANPAKQHVYTRGSDQGVGEWTEQDAVSDVP